MDAYDVIVNQPVVIDNVSISLIHSYTVATSYGRIWLIEFGLVNGWLHTVKPVRNQDKTISNRPIIKLFNF